MELFTPHVPIPTETVVYIAKAVEKKCVYNMFNRKRHTDGANPYSKMGMGVLRQAVNFMVQSAASDITVYGIMPELIVKMIHETPRSLVVGNIHDAVVIDMHPEEKDKVVSIVDYVFRNPQLPGTTHVWSSLTQIPITYDITELGGRDE